MNNQSPRCCVCGCALSKTDDACPICGTHVSFSEAPDSNQAWQSTACNVVPNEATNKFRGRHAAPEVASSKGAFESTFALIDQRRQPLLIALVVGIVALLMVIGAVGFQVWSADEALKQRVAQIDEPKEALVESPATFPVGIGNNAGSIAGGGVVVFDGSGAYLAQSNGIVYQEAAPLDETVQTHDVAADHASCLNLFDRSLYYLASSPSTVSDSFKGTLIQKVEEPSNREPAGRVAETLFQVGGSEKIACLTVKDGWLYFVIQGAEECSVMKMPCDGSVAETELGRFSAQDSWLFVENETIYVLTTSNSSWSMQSRAIGNENGSFKTIMDGSGKLATACLNEGTLYYALNTGQATSHLLRKSLQGESAEFSEVDGVVRIAASGDIVSVLDKAGGLVWIDDGTGFTHDISRVLVDVMPKANPQSIGLSIYDDWICCRDNAGNFVEYNVNSELVAIPKTSDTSLADESETGSSDSASELSKVEG